jgi:hypothetical protein
MLLYDAFYNYGIALNATMKQYGRLTSDIYRNGTLISNNSKRSFMGKIHLRYRRKKYI